MILVAKLISWISLIAVIAPSILFLIGCRIELDQVKWIMLISTVIWFVSASIWMWEKKSESSK